MTDHQKQKKKPALCYADNHEHLADELRKLDLLIQRQVKEFRLKNRNIQDMAVSHQMYISDQEVDCLLSHNENVPAESSDLTQIQHQIDNLHNHIKGKVKQSIKQGIYLSLPQLAHLFNLSPFELQTVIICLAPELDLKYDRLYAYLQDDITRKKPSIDLVLDLLYDTRTDQWTARALFSRHASLFYSDILQMTEDPHSPSGSSDLARFLTLDPRILNYLLGNNSIDERLVGLAHLCSPLPSMDQILIDKATKTGLTRLIKHNFSRKKAHPNKMVVYFSGPYGVGKRDFALGICGQLNCQMLYLDLEKFTAHVSDIEKLLKLSLREGLLMQAVIYICSMDVVLREDERAKSILKTITKVIEEYGWLTFLAGEIPWSRKGLFENVLFYDAELPLPDVSLREESWRYILKDSMPGVETRWAVPLSRQFRLTPGQIRDAFELAKTRFMMNDEGRNITISDLYAASRSQSNHKLKELALKIDPNYGWEDIVLPENKMAQLKEICKQVKHRHKVFCEWGFEDKLSHGKGLSLLFYGPSGTGKTMAAEVMAHELQLDLYKIDLSGVVSKYIGETEKNLSKIFNEAETSNAILFFDEADALFGKRTQISDAHDRYANIETSYLLQKMEEYEGVVILATNIRENMDEAFTRRIRFILEFPFPDDGSRLQIWKTHFPKEAPVSDEIDYEFISKHFRISGGNIKNIVLNSAFMAAEDGGIIRMEHIMLGVKREFEKIGKLWNEKYLAGSSGYRIT